MAYDKRGTLSWCLYDMANSAFPTVITTFVFATYFTTAVAETSVVGQSIWGNAMAAAALIIAVLAPVTGAIADFSGGRKAWLAAFSLVCIVATASLWFVTPDASSIPIAIAGIILATIGFELGMVFYNAMLPDVAGRDYYGRVSGWGWGLGYMGGLCALVIALFGFVQPDTPLFGVTKDGAAHVRATTLLVAVWFAVFCLPTFLFVKEKPRVTHPMGTAVKMGLGSLFNTFRHIRTYKTAFWFLLARMIYTDGLNTLFAFGGIYAAGAFGMELSEVIMFGIALNVTAGLGAAVFAFLDDKWGAKTVLIIALGSLIALGSVAFTTDDKTVFWTVGVIVGTFIGPSQAASRSLMARLAPEALRAEFFGLYALSGKATAFLGPLVLAWVTSVFDSQRLGMVTILVFLAVGLGLLILLRTGEAVTGSEGSSTQTYDRP